MKCNKMSINMGRGANTKVPPEMTWHGRNKKTSVATHVRWRDSSQWPDYGDAYQSHQDQHVNFTLRVMKSCLTVLIKTMKCSGSLWSFYKEQIVAGAREEAERWPIALHRTHLAQVGNDEGLGHTESVEMMIYQCLWDIFWKLEEELTGPADGWRRE